MCVRKRKKKIEGERESEIERKSVRERMKEDKRMCERENERRSSGYVFQA